MIEQTPMVVTEWTYTATTDSTVALENLRSNTYLDVMQKRAPTKKGLACRFSCKFVASNHTILSYVAEDSYVIDLEDYIDLRELLTMLRNSFSKYKEQFDLRKLGTALNNTELSPLDESKINLEAILPLLNG